MSQYRFFRPFVGQLYNSGCGIYSKRIMILIYAISSFNDTNYDDCMICAKGNKMASHKVRITGKRYQIQNLSMQDGLVYAIKEKTLTFRNLSKIIASIIGTTNYEETWKYLSCTVYCQSILFAAQFRHSPVFKPNLMQDDFNTFIETIKELQPHIIIACGSFIHTPIKDNEYVCNKEIQDETLGYICYIRIPEVFHTITIINSYHPSSPAWYIELKKTQQFIKNELNKR